MVTPEQRVYFDLETGGLDEKKHAIIQLAAICPARNAEFEVKIKFRMNNAEPEALEVNSYDPETWFNEAISPRDAALKFKEFCQSHAFGKQISKKGKPFNVAQLCAHNGKKFDGPFLFSWLKRLDVGFFPASYKVLDTLALAEFCLPDLDDHQQPTIAKHFGIDTDGAHDALNDVRVLVEITKRMEAMIVRQKEIAGNE